MKNNWHCPILGITNRAEIEKCDEEKLRELLVSKEEWKFGRSKKKTEFRPHRLATLIEHILAGRDLEAANINLFAEHLRRGWLWAGPTEPFKKCPWHGRKDLPNVEDWRQWREIIMPFLKKETNEDPRQLTVFATMLSARKFVYAGGTDSFERLGDDKPAYAWNQLENRLGKAWKSMASWHRKRNSKNSA